MFTHGSIANWDSGEIRNTGYRIGSGEVKYIAPYARRQYYGTATSRSYDANRGGLWFERMKTKNKAAIKKLLED